MYDSSASGSYDPRSLLDIFSTIRSLFEFLLCLDPSNSNKLCSVDRMQCLSWWQSCVKKSVIHAPVLPYHVYCYVPIFKRQLLVKCYVYTEAKERWISCRTKYVLTKEQRSGTRTSQNKMYNTRGRLDMSLLLTVSDILTDLMHQKYHP